MPRSPRSLIGNAVHEGAAAYDASRIHGTGLTINEAAGVAVDYILDKSSEVDWVDLSPKDVEAKTLQIHQRYCAEISPKFDFVIDKVKFKLFQETKKGFNRIRRKIVSILYKKD